MLLPLLFSFVLAQAPTPASGAEIKPPPAVSKEAVPDETPVVAQHQMDLNGKTISYATVSAQMPIRTAAGETEARIFYVAYSRTDIPKGMSRPLLFAFNGGPGSASLWLHMGAIGPKRVKLGDDGSLPPPPYSLVDNESTWLDRADLVFIDPVGTGYSRAAKPELGAKFWSVDGDIESIGEFIRMYLTRNHRWGSPLFLAGESYGTLRAAGLSSHLLDNGIALNGVALISSVLNFKTIITSRSNDMAYPLFLPTYAAIAAYHHKLSSSISRDVPKLLAEVERWAENDYPAILAKGDSLPASERAEAIDRLARYTGLSKQFLDRDNLRVDPGQFEAELMRDQKQTLGRYDARLLGTNEDPTSAYPGYDASYTAVRAPFTTLYNQYLREELKYQTDMPYYVLGEGLTAPWNFGREGASALDVSDRLRGALVQNPFMKVFVAAGRYDLATPFYEARYTMNHLGLEPNTRKNLTFQEYNAGHMMYIDTPSRRKLKADISAWLDSALGVAPTKSGQPG